MIITFRDTWELVKDGRKTRTMRRWSDRHFKSVCDLWDREDPPIIDAYDKSPRAGGRRFGYIILTEMPCRITLEKFRNYHKVEHQLKTEGGLWRDIDHFIEWYRKQYKVSMDDELSVLNFMYITKSGN